MYYYISDINTIPFSLSKLISILQELNIFRKGFPWTYLYLSFFLNPIEYMLFGVPELSIKKKGGGEILTLLCS